MNFSNMKKLIVIHLFILGSLLFFKMDLFAQKSSEKVSWKKFNQKHNENLMSLSTGDSKETVIEKLGGIISYKVILGPFCKSYEFTNPNKNEIFPKEGVRREILHYVVKISKNKCSASVKTTALIFEDGVLIAVGNNYLRQAKGSNP